MELTDGSGQAAEREVALQRSRSSPPATNHLQHATPGPGLKVAKQKTQALVIWLKSKWMYALPRGRLEGRNIADETSVALA